MGNYILKRTLLIIPTMFLVSIIVFLLQRFIPGSAVDVIEAQFIAMGQTDIDRAAIIHPLGLDVPILQQYINWIGGIITRGDFGTSMLQNKPVLDLIASRVGPTLELGFMSVIFANLFGLPLGIYTAARQGKLADTLFRPLSVLLISIPSFWLATMVMIYPVRWWGWSPSMELISFTQDPWGNFVQFAIPAVINGAVMSGVTMRMVRTQMLDVLRQDYVRTAWSKGLGEKTVIIRHSIKNAFIPVITVIGGQLANVIGGTVIMENIFNIPGMGQLALTALNDRDYPVVSAIVLLVSLVVLICNLLVDISYSWLDPRVRYQ